MSTILWKITKYRGGRHFLYALNTTYNKSMGKRCVLFPWTFCVENM